MLDIKFVAENVDWVKKSLARKGFDSSNVDKLIEAYLAMNKLKTSTQQKMEEKNKLSNAIKSASSEERPNIIAKSKAIGEELKQEQLLLDEAQAKFDEKANEDKYERERESAKKIFGMLPEDQAKEFNDYYNSAHFNATYVLLRH